MLPINVFENKHLHLSLITHQDRTKQTEATVTDAYGKHLMTGAHGQAAFAEAAGPLAMHVCMSGLVKQNQSMFSWHNLMRDTF